MKQSEKLDSRTTLARLPQWCRAAVICLMDCCFLNIAIWFSCIFFTYFLKQNSPIISIYMEAMPALSVACFLIFMTMGIYKSMWSHLALTDMITIAVAVFLASFFSYCALRIAGGVWQNPIIAVTTFYLFLSLCSGIRLLPALIQILRRAYSMNVRRQAVPILVIGAGEAANALIKDMQGANPASNYRLIGLVDDDPRKAGHKLRGVNILGRTEDIPALVRKYNVQELIIAIPSATTAQRQRLLAIAMPTGCKLRFMSRVAKLTEPGVADLHDLDIGDLLGRPEVQLDPETMRTYLTDSVVLVTGGGGSIGAELCRQIMRFHPKRLVIFDQYENDASDLAQELRIVFRDKLEQVDVRIGSVQDLDRLEDVFAECKPQVVFHAAAYKHVPLMEQCPHLAIENNVFGTYRVARTALRHGVRRFVMISSDKAINPTNVMGASKRLSELIIHSLNGGATEFVAVRFGNVLGSHGSVVPIFRKQIETGGPITITHPEIIRYFMTIPEAARLVLQAGAIAHGGETFVLDMGEPVKIIDLANTMIEMAGLVPGKDIQIEYIGLRPGEKLYEELLLDEEGIEKTSKDKIYVAHVEMISVEERERLLQALRDCIVTKGDMKACIRTLLPEYQPQED